MIDKGFAYMPTKGLQGVIYFAGSYPFFKQLATAQGDRRPKRIRREGVTVVEGLMLLERSREGIEHLVSGERGSKRKVSACQALCEAQKVRMNPFDFADKS